MQKFKIPQTKIIYYFCRKQPLEKSKHSLIFTYQHYNYHILMHNNIFVLLHANKIIQIS